MFENLRRGRQARNFTTNVPKILDLKLSSEQIFFRKLSLGAPEKHAHVLGDKQWDYDNTIAELARAELLSPVYEDLYNHVWHRRKNFLMDYKSDEFQFTTDGTWASVQRQ